MRRNEQATCHGQRATCRPRLQTSAARAAATATQNAREDHVPRKRSSSFYKALRYRANNTEPQRTRDESLSMLLRVKIVSVHSALLLGHDHGLRTLVGDRRRGRRPGSTATRQRRVTVRMALREEPESSRGFAGGGPSWDPGLEIEVPFEQRPVTQLLSLVIIPIYVVLDIKSGMSEALSQNWWYLIWSSSAGERILCSQG